MGHESEATRPRPKYRYFYGVIYLIRGTCVALVPVCFAGLPGGKNEAEQAAAAIVAAARQLQPLLEQAEEMQRRGILIQDGDASSTDPVVVAKATLRRHFVQGSSLEVLKSINQRLNAQKAATAMAETAVA